MLFCFFSFILYFFFFFSFFPLCCLLFLFFLILIRFVFSSFVFLLFDFFSSVFTFLFPFSTFFLFFFFFPSLLSFVFFLSSCFIFWCFYALVYALFIFYTLNKTALGETVCLSNPRFLLTGQVSSFLIQIFFYNDHLDHTCYPATNCSTFTTYTHHAPPLCMEYFPSNPHLWKLKTSLGVPSILKISFCPHT